MTRGKLFLMVALGAATLALSDKLFGVDYGDLNLFLINVHRTIYVVFGAVLYANCVKVFGKPWEKKKKQERGDDNR
jgi:hypothetical protein